MSKEVLYLGLDVHAENIAVAIADANVSITTEVISVTLVGQSASKVRATNPERRRS